jgi:hypothetical protein
MFQVEPTPATMTSYISSFLWPEVASAGSGLPGAILHESLHHERATLATYGDLLGFVEGRSVLLEEYARKMIAEEGRPQGDVDRMLR